MDKNKVFEEDLDFEKLEEALDMYDVEGRGMENYI